MCKLLSKDWCLRCGGFFVCAKVCACVRVGARVVCGLCVFVSLFDKNPRKYGFFHFFSSGCFSIRFSFRFRFVFFFGVDFGVFFLGERGTCGFLDLLDFRCLDFFFTFFVFLEGA